MLHEQNFASFVGSYYTCCDVIIFVNSKKAKINVIENSYMFWRNDNTLASLALPEIAMSLLLFYSIP